jgi:hypothetical protein
MDRRSLCPQAQLGAVLDFMYLGEVSIRHTQLESFLSLAEELKVGLNSS